MEKTLFWLAIPQGLRIALAALLLLIIFRRVVLWIVKDGICYVGLAIEKILTVIFSLRKHYWRFHL
ncbi:hypothetical protein ACI2OX_04740 [Bacillus sp. N9]